MPSEIATSIESQDYDLVSNSTKSKRVREFTRGRTTAGTLLSQFGETGKVGVADDRSPSWPNGFVGSISHSSSLVWVVVARESAIASVGIDTEQVADGKTQIELRPEIATPQEWSIADSMGLSPEATFTLVFSAKEAFYKCCYPLSQLYFGFKDVAVQAVDDGKIRIGMCSSNPNLACPNSNEQPRPECMPVSLNVFYFLHHVDVFTAAWIHPPASSHQESP